MLVVGPGAPSSVLAQRFQLQYTFLPTAFSLFFLSNGDGLQPNSPALESLPSRYRVRNSLSVGALRLSEGWQGTAQEDKGKMDLIAKGTY